MKFCSLLFMCSGSRYSWRSTWGRQVISISIVVMGAMVCALLFVGCVQRHRTFAFSSRLLGHIADGGVTLGEDKLVLGASKQELPEWCHPIGERSFECASMRLAEPWRVSTRRDGRVTQITLWELQGPSDFVCRLYKSIDSDYRQLVGRPVSDVPCECGEFGCKDAQGAMREWRLSGGATLGLVISSHPEQPRAPDGTPISTIGVAVSESLDAE
jgi:hypothetical protein